MALSIHFSERNDLTKERVGCRAANGALRLSRVTSTVIPGEVVHEVSDKLSLENLFGIQIGGRRAHFPIDHRERFPEFG